MLPSRLRRDGPSIFGPSPRGRFDSRTVRTLALLAAGVFSGACGDAGDSAPAPTPPVTAAGPAKRIVSLAPSHTELLFALGAGDAVVGVTRFCDRPPEARTRTVVGDAQSISQETVAALEPDLVVLNAAATAAALGPLRSRLRVLAVPTDTLPQLLDAVGVLGAAVGKPERAKSLRAEMEGALEEARRRNAGRPKTRVLLVVQHEPFFVAGKGSYVHALLETLGCENAAGDIEAAWPTLSAEALLLRAPDALIDAALGATGQAAPEERVRAWWRERYPMLPAVRDGRVRSLRDEAALRPGPGLASALRTLEEAVGK